MSTSFGVDTNTLFGLPGGDGVAGRLPQPSLPISTTQLGALVLGLPWQRVGHTGAITLV